MFPSYTEILVASIVASLIVMALSEKPDKRLEFVKISLNFVLFKS